MGGRRILSDEQIDEMAALRESGLTLKQIVAHFAAKGVAITANTIAWQCLRVGADMPAHLQRWAAPIRPVLHIRKGKAVRPFSAEEDARLRALDLEGLTMTQIGRAMDRAANSVRARLMILARHDARAEEQSLPESTNGEL